MNCWNSWKLGASRFHLQLASLELDLNIHMQMGCYAASSGGTTRSSSLAACIKVLPVLTSTQVENCSIAAALFTILPRL